MGVRFPQSQQLHRIRGIVVECLEKLQVLKLQLGQMRETVKETRGSLLAEALNIDTHVRYDSKRFRFYVGSNPTDVSKI